MGCQVVTHTHTQRGVCVCVLRRMFVDADLEIQDCGLQWGGLAYRLRTRIYKFTSYSFEQENGFEQAVSSYQIDQGVFEL